MKSHLRKLSVEKIKKPATSSVFLTLQQLTWLDLQETQSQNRTCLAVPASTNIVWKLQRIQVILLSTAQQIIQTLSTMQVLAAFQWKRGNIPYSSGKIDECESVGAFPPFSPPVCSIQHTCIVQIQVEKTSGLLWYNIIAKPTSVFQKPRVFLKLYFKTP